MKTRQSQPNIFSPRFGSTEWKKRNDILAAIRIEALTKDHDRSTFICGDTQLDTYFRTQAGQDDKKDASRIYVASDDSGIVGFYALCVASCARKAVPDEILRGLPKYPDLPGVLIGRLARHSRVQGQGFGDRLLLDAFDKVKAINDLAAVSLVFVDSKNSDSATKLYEKFGFIQSADNPDRLLLPFQTVLKALASVHKA